MSENQSPKQAADELSVHRPRLEDMPDLVRVEEAAAWLGCSVVTVRRMIHGEKLSRVKVGRLDRVPRTALERLQEGSAGHGTCEKGWHSAAGEEG